ncbi:hypothetical protein [Agromyces aerolatus]|uniref:hypothetical protein n=1 Tax=Agromyces sp. LY-1074 TaxID=3074080 RepID=UPI00285822D8|nr:MULTISPECIES: hypothetical protein [unclassified Agromyces]MDR5699292.1 hypothetical protein [Agromyces sp. LY-1074]MDR5705588.1 hypothetical protein [Agromyces sp. LY-1358]
MTVHGVREATRDDELAWMLGGSLLVGATVLPLVLQPVAFAVGGSSVLWAAMLAAALLILAFGVRGAGSITARRPLGTITLTALAVLNVTMAVLWLTPMLAADHPTAEYLAVTATITQVDLALRFALALVATTQIARAGVVPRPWNRAPLWCLAAVTVAWLIQIVVRPSATMDPAALSWTVTLGGTISSLATIFLGVLAIALANRHAGARGARTAGGLEAHARAHDR